MEQAARSVRIVRFGVYETDIHEGVLRKSGRRVTLQDQPFQVLALLLANPGKLVTREELQGRIWPADTFVDFDLGLNTAIKKIRAALGDSADNPRFIETVPKRGYRFIYPIEQLEPAAVVEPHETPVSMLIGESLPPPPQIAVRRYRWWPALAVAVVLTVSALVAFRIVSQRSEARRKADSPIESVAVLPFETASAGPEEEAFANGMTEELITQLAQLGWPGVAARAAVLPYKGRAQSASLIGAALNVDAIVVGTVTREGSRVRITAHLIQVSTDKERWTGKYTKDAANILALQSEVAVDITAGIRDTLTNERLKRLADRETEVPAAYAAYVRGQGFMRAYDQPAKYEYARLAFTEAVRADPSFASAYAGLGQACARKYKELSDDQWRQCAAQNCRNAMERGPKRPAPYVCFGVLHFQMGEYDQAVQAFSSALEFDPKNADAYRGRGLSNENLDKQEDAEEDLRQSVAADSKDWRGNIALGVFYDKQARYHEAIAQYKRASELRPDNSEPLYIMGVAHIELGEYKEAVDVLTKSLSLHPWTGAYQNMGTALLNRRHFSEAIESFKKALELDPESYSAHNNLARAYFWADQPELARPHYEQAIERMKQRLLVNPKDVAANLMLAVDLAMLRQESDALSYLRQAEDLQPGGKEYCFWAAVVHLQFRNRANAFVWLRKARELQYSLPEIVHAPEFYSLRDDPEFRSIVSK